MACILVTGATGFVGSELVKRLLREGERVRIFHRAASTMDLIGDAIRDVEPFTGDIRDPAALDDALRGCELVYHTAARIGFGGRGERKLLMRTNVDGTATVVNAALRQGIRRLVHVSSMAAFGRPERPNGIIDEESEWQRSKANSAYALSKYLAELEVHRGVAEGLDAVIVNPALIFGVGRTGDNTRRIIDRLRAGTLPGIAAGGTNVVDVEDVVEGMILAMRSGRSGERYFLGSQNLSWRTIIQELADALGVAPPRLRLGARPALAVAYASEAFALVTGARAFVTRESVRAASKTYRYSNRKARHELGWNPRPFHETAQRIAEALEEASQSASR